MTVHEKAAAYADRIEQELRASGAWSAAPPPEAAFESERAFFADMMSFYQWLQWVFLARIREIVQTSGQFPSRSQVAAYGVRELDGDRDAGPLLSVLSEFDEFIEEAR